MLIRPPGSQIRSRLVFVTWFVRSIITQHEPLYVPFQNHTRVNRDGYFIVFSDETRHRLLNQAHCLDRIRALLRDASEVPKGLTEDEMKTIEQR